MSSFPEPLHWNGDDVNPVDLDRGWGVPYYCPTCHWSGRGGVAAFAHARLTHHAIVLRDAPEFGPIIVGPRKDP